MNSKNNFFIDLIKTLVGGYTKKHYSQEGEDLLLDRIFDNQSSGTYLDIGAHHPIRFSNTYKLYKRGWKGINVDAMPGSMRLFNLLRPRDINLECPISDKKETLTYFRFPHYALNTLSKEVADKRIADGITLIEKIDLETETVEAILDKHLGDKSLDLITIDVEGLDLQVLKSNNWSKYKPKVIVAECIDSDLQTVASNEISSFLKDYGYILHSKLHNSVFYIDQTFLKSH
jgi:FkbM family methyltransferase